MNGINFGIIHPRPGDTIILTYDKELVSPTQVSDTYDLALEHFPDYPILVVPKGVTVLAKKQ